MSIDFKKQRRNNSNTTVSYTHLDVYKRQGLHLSIGRLKFGQQVLVADIVGETILGVDIMNAYGFIVVLKNNVMRIRKE